MCLKVKILKHSSANSIQQNQNSLKIKNAAAKGVPGMCKLTKKSIRVINFLVFFCCLHFPPTQLQS